MTRSKTLVDRFIAKLEFAGRSMNTLKTYRQKLDKLDIWLRENTGKTITTEEGIVQIRGADLEEWQYHLRESGKGSATEHLFAASAKSFFKWATDAGYITTDPSKVITSVKVVPEEQVHLEWNQVERLFQSYRSTKETLDLCILGIGFTMGLRNSAICGLNVGDYHNNKLTYTNKGGSRVSAYVPDFIAEMLDRYIAEYRSTAAPEDPLFINKNKKRFGRRDILRKCHRAGQFIGMPQLTAHAMRRSCLTRVSELQGIELAQSLANHSSHHTTERYIYQSHDNMERLYEDMNILDFPEDSGGKDTVK